MHNLVRIVKTAFGDAILRIAPQGIYKDVHFHWTVNGLDKSIILKFTIDIEKIKYFPIVENIEILALLDQISAIPAKRCPLFCGNR